MDKEYLVDAVNEAFRGMRNNCGGPFGAIITLDNKVIGKGHNEVTSTNDPTAHAEVVAIRKACKNISNYDLSNAVLYASCEPCPMCLSAIYWSGIKTVYYAGDKYDAERAGFDDKFIYDELALPMEERAMKMTRIKLPQTDELFDEWINKQDKKVY